MVLKYVSTFHHILTLPEQLPETASVIFIQIIPTAMFTHRMIQLLTLLLISGSLAQGQNQTKLTDADYASYPHWMTMMKDPHGNFFETQKAFNLYWKDREIPKEGSGYSLFKRWEYLWQSGINPDGTYPEPDHVYKEFNKFVSSHPQDGKLKTGTGVWRELGPKSRRGNYAAYMGRLNAIAFHPTDTATFYVGAPTGGFWTTHDGGQSWTTSTDNQPVMGVSAILVDPVNPDIILIGTGDRDLGGGGMGVFRSMDGGLTWTPFNSGMGNVTIGMFAQAAANPLVILAAANGGIFKTVDGGENWVKTSPDNSNFTDIRFKPRSSTIAYAASPLGFYRSENAGDTWSLVPSGSGYVTGNRLVIGVTPANDSLVYLISGYTAEFLGCFLSRDFGHSFTRQSSSPNIIDGQISYNLCIHVDSRNPNLITVGAINIWNSIDGGKNWECNQWSSPIHVDQHAIVENPLNNRLYVGNDGGIYYSDGGATNWVSCSNGLGIGQIYKIGVSANEPDKVLAGFQDNCSSVWNGMDWTTIGGGDGMECAVDRTDSRYSYVSAQFGLIYKLFNNNSVGWIAGSNINGITDKGDWITPFLVSEGDGNTMVAGYQSIWISRNVRSEGSVRWRKISDNPPSNSYNTVEQSPADVKVLYASTDDGKLFRTDNLLDEEVKWTLLPATLPILGGQQPYMDIECHPYDEKTVYLVNHKKVFKSTDKGFTLQDITGSLPDIPLNSIVFDKSSNEGLYVGSNAGVYYRDADMADWALYGKSIPVSVKVTELEIYYDPVSRQGSRLRASTYGRGLWEIGLAVINPVPPGQLTASVTDESVELTWNPPFYKQNVQSYRVYRNGMMIATINAFSFTDLTIEKEVTCFYKITAVYQGGMESGFSNEIMATVISPVVLPYSQQFEKGTGAWNAKYSFKGWNYGTSDQLEVTGREGHYFAISSMAASAGTRVADYLQSPGINLSRYEGKTVTLSFAYTMRRFRNYDKFSVLYRQAPDSAWVTLKNLEPPDKYAWVWDTIMINLPEKALTSQAQIGFMYDNSSQTAMGAAVDDVKIFVNTTSVETVDNKNRVRVFPNPTKGQVTLELNTLLPDEINLKVYSSSGQLVLGKNISCHSGITIETIDLSEQPKGIYMLSLKPKNGGWQHKNTIILYPENDGR
ncbi:MAG: T9SS type A sorting domain-containing protein, partial [Bacteroidia bacterium]|nr:T9SS type A sorting domain-containing protein [Bacteroidia bacterium]